MKHYTIYTDGSAWPNDGTGVGSFAFIVRHNDSILIEQTGIEEPSTNNRMELQAAISGLQYVLNKNPGQNPNLLSASVVSDSAYVVNGINSWLFGWKQTNWKQGKLKNLDLWQKLDEVVQKFGTVRGNWIKGHSGIKYNEQCDEMAEWARMEYSKEKDQRETDLDKEFMEIVSIRSSK